MLKQEHLEQLSRITAQWDKSEALIKKAELLSSEVANPAIFELRYAGRRVVDALLAAEGRLLDRGLTADQQFDMYLGDAELCCLRAQHDAVDAMLLYIKRDIGHMKANFGADRIHSIFSDYIRLERMILAVDQKIIRSRGTRDDRKEIYGNLGDANIDELAELYTNLRLCEDVLVAERERASRNQRSQQMVAVGGVVVAIIGIVVGIVLRFLG